MIIYFIKQLNKIKLSKVGIFLFLAGIFFLPSTLFIGILFLLPAALIGSLLNKNSFFKDRWNFPFLLFGVLIVISAILQNFFLINNYEAIWDPKLSIIGLGNWLPFIWFFWAFQPFLDTSTKRKSFALFLTAGTFPVLLTGFGQYFFEWYGPIKTLNGLIIWYQRPIDYPGGLSGLFNNQNYTGSWLNLVWPFSLALYLDKKETFLKKIAAMSFIFSIGFAGFLTYSRNAWIGLLTTFPLVTGKKGISTFFSLVTITIISLLLFFSFSSNMSDGIQAGLIKLYKNIYLQFSSEGYGGEYQNRFEIFLSAFRIINLNPFFGTGAASFSAIHSLETLLWKGHTHNLLLELGISYGLPSAFILFFTLTYILILSGRRIILNNYIFEISLIDRAFWASIFFFLLSQLFDIQYFDGKISIVTWILISGLKNIITEKKSE